MEAFVVLLAFIIPLALIFLWAWSSYKVAEYLQQTYNLQTLGFVILLIFIALIWWPASLLVYFLPKIYPPQNNNIDS